MSFLCLIASILASCIYAVVLYNRATGMYRLDTASSAPAPGFIRRTKRIIWIGMIIIVMLTLGAIVPGLMNGINDIGERIYMTLMIGWMFSVIGSSTVYMLRLQKLHARQEHLREHDEPPSKARADGTERFWRIALMLLVGTLLYVIVRLVF